MNQRQLFLQHIAQTSGSPAGIEPAKAEGIYIFDKSGKKYIDLISGISVSNIGHRHPAVIKAITQQMDQYMHVMVYGEYIQTPQVKLAQKLSALLPEQLNCSYFVNSGSEAIEGAMKLAKKFTGRTEIISFENAYHGSTQGALSCMGNEYFKNAFRPLLPDIRILEFNNTAQLNQITEKTACVIIEPIQGEAGVVEGEKKFIQQLRKRCSETKTLLIFDEIQTGCGRTGKMFAFKHYDIIPDVLVLAKGLGGGMPIGVFISSKNTMDTFMENPVLGHITTFGGHPVCCASALATLEVLENENMVAAVNKKEELFHTLLKHPYIKEIRSKGLLIALDFESEELNKNIISKCMEQGVITDWFLFNSNSMRIAPPLTITEEEIKLSCELILKSINFSIQNR